MRRASATLLVTWRNRRRAAHRHRNARHGRAPVAHGEVQAARLRTWLTDHESEPFTAVYSSPYLRASDTARIVCAHAGDVERSYSTSGYGSEFGVLDRLTRAGIEGRSGRAEALAVSASSTTGGLEARADATSRSACAACSTRWGGSTPASASSGRHEVVIYVFRYVLERLGEVDCSSSTVKPSSRTVRHDLSRPPTRGNDFVRREARERARDRRAGHPACSPLIRAGAPARSTASFSPSMHLPPMDGTDKFERGQLRRSAATPRLLGASCSLPSPRCERARDVRTS